MNLLLFMIDEAAGLEARANIIAKANLITLIVAVVLIAVTMIIMNIGYIQSLLDRSFFVGSEDIQTQNQWIKSIIAVLLIIMSRQIIMYFYERFMP